METWSSTPSAISNGRNRFTHSSVASASSIARAPQVSAATTTMFEIIQPGAAKRRRSSRRNAVDTAVPSCQRSPLLDQNAKK